MAEISDPRILVALDYNNQTQCLKLVRQLDPSLCRLKVGKELFTSCGPQVVEELQTLGFEVFLDLKFHDIPNTVAQAVKAAADLGVWMVNVHASGGARMLEAAADVVAGYQQPPLLIGVTVLTSMMAEDLEATGIQAPPAEQVVRLAKLVRNSGLDGVVCSAQETAELRQELKLAEAAASEKPFVLVTPGIRPEGSDAGDQRRVVTPAQALANGSDYLVVGRPITRAKDPAAACREIALSCG